MAKKAPPSLADFSIGSATSTRRAPFKLKRFDPGATPFASGDKTADTAQVTALAKEIDALQDLFYADRRFRLLVVLQGTDTAGKDGTLRDVFGETSALGMRAVSWKAPVGAELTHDFLWRIHAQVPVNGEVVVFNRSHYEDVLVPVVHGTLSKADTALRYAHINDFERMLAESGTVLLKFMLHISNDEQRRRLQARIDDPDKHWKFNPGDLAERKLWDDYQRAYARAIAATGTKWAPWVIVPADSKTHRNLMVARVVRDALKGLALKYPTGDPALAGLKVT